MTITDKDSVELRRLHSPPSPADDMAEFHTVTTHNGRTEPLGLATKRRTIASSTVRCLSRWLLTVAVICAMVAVLVSYVDQPVMDKKTKSMFNTLITGLSIALGLAITSSLDDMIQDLRWCLLAQRFRSRHKVERILQADKISHLFWLAFTSRRLTIHVAVTAWVILLLVSPCHHCILETSTKHARH